jgi:hypothetical protein
MQAIQTKYLGPTTYRGGRIKATCQAKSVTLPWDYNVGVDENHRSAADRLRVKLGWGTETHGDTHSGVLADGTYVHVMGR